MQSHAGFDYSSYQESIIRKIRSIKECVDDASNSCWNGSDDPVQLSPPQTDMITEINQELQDLAIIPSYTHENAESDVSTINAELINVCRDNKARFITSVFKSTQLVIDDVTGVICAYV